MHAVIEALGAGPVEMFASSGGAVTALALVAAYPDDVTTLVAHEPPLIPVLPDAAAAERARAGVRDAYEAKGSGRRHGGLHRDDVVARASSPTTTSPSPRRIPPSSGCRPRTTAPATTRCCPTGPGRSAGYRPDFDALAAAPTRIVIAVGEESAGTFTGRTSVATAELLGQQATVFPSHHGGFLGGEHGYAGQPEAFARRLRDVLGGEDS